MEFRTFLASPDNCNAQEVTDLINDIYKVDEEPIWIKGHWRTSIAEIERFIEAGEILVASAEDKIIGAIHTKPIEPEVGWFGMLGVLEEYRGNGIASALYEDSENLIKSMGCSIMQCEILIPHKPVIPSKPILQAWYGKLGFELKRSLAMQEMYPHAVRDLTMPCELEMYQKSL